MTANEAHPPGAAPRLRLALAALLAASPRAAPAQDAMPFMGGETVEVSMLEWDPVEREARSLVDTDGVYTVQPSGDLALPFLPVVNVLGEMPSAVAARLEGRLRNELALERPPSVTIRVASYRPLTVVGLVEDPGAHPYTPGMTALEALALAGGVFRNRDRGSREVAEYIRATGALEQLLADRRIAEIDLARVQAAIDGSDDIALAAAPRSPRLREYLEAARVNLAKQNRRVAREIRELELEAEKVTAGIAALEEKQRNLEGRREKAAEEVARINELADRGLGRRVTGLDAEQALADIEGRLIDLSVTLLNENEKLRAIERRQERVPEEFAEELWRERARLIDHGIEIDARVAAQRRLVALHSAGALNVEEGTEYDERGVDLAVVRGGEERPLGPSDTLMPGDTLMVSIDPAGVSEFEASLLADRAE